MCIESCNTSEKTTSYIKNNASVFTTSSSISSVLPGYVNKPYKGLVIPEIGSLWESDKCTIHNGSESAYMIDLQLESTR